MENYSVGSLGFSLTGGSQDAVKEIRAVKNGLKQLAKVVDGIDMDALAGKFISMSRVLSPFFKTIRRGSQDLANLNSVLKQLGASRMGKLLAFNQNGTTPESVTAFLESEGAKSRESELKKAQKEAENARKKEAKEQEIAKKQEQKQYKKGLANFKKYFGGISNIAKIIQYRLIRGLLSAITKSLGEASNELARFNSDYRTALSQFNSAGQMASASLVAIAAPLIELITPTIYAIAQGMGNIANQVSIVTANIKGQTKYTKINLDYMKDYLATLKAATFGFDSFNSLGSSGTMAGMFSNEEFDDSAVEKAKASLYSLMGNLSSLLPAIGTIMVFTGSPITGIGLIAAGLGLGIFGAVETFTDIESTVGDKLKAIMKIVNVSLLAVGTIALLAGGPAALPWALPLIIAGGVGLLASIDWDFIPNQVKTVLSLIMTAAGSASLAIGIILCATGVMIPLGIGLIVAGASALGTAVAINADAILDWIKGVWNSIANFFTATVLPFFQKLVNQVINHYVIDRINGIIELINKLPFANFGKIERLNWGGVGGFFANGGMPDVGTLFFAGEAGAEMVFNSSAGTGVANVEQISNAFYAAMVRAFNDGIIGQTGDGNVYIDSDAVGKVVASSRGFRSEANRIGLIKV